MTFFAKLQGTFQYLLIRIQLRFSCHQPSKLWVIIRFRVFPHYSQKKCKNACLIFTRNVFTTGSRDETIRVWSIRHGTLVTLFDMHRPVISFQMTHDAGYLVITLEDCRYVPFMCLHNSPAAESVKSQSQVEIQLTGGEILLWCTITSITLRY